ncbi:MAG: NAD-dependent epimerase/dehydratase family protein [Bacteroidota bacterium]|nr:NAD-dependent epimerase/dehydratase family protein [Bacteroidota bacterium]
MNVLVTGAGGFVGQHYIRTSGLTHHCIPASLRNQNPEEINLDDVDVVLHLAVVAHDPEMVNHDIQYKVNLDLTTQLADHAKLAGVKHFIFMSSVKVYGEGTDKVLNEDSVCIPVDAYGKSKLEAEKYLLQQQTDNFAVAVIRPPLVYGPGVKGNMLRMLHLASKKIPLPFANAHNRRSVVYIENLIALVNHIIEVRASGIYIAGDAVPVSTGELFMLIRANLKGSRLLFPTPVVLQKLLRAVKPGLFNRLFGSFEVSNKSTNAKLKFIPPFTTEDGIKDMVSWYQTSLSKSPD